MTTASSENVKPRDLNILFDLPYSEMTDEEIEMVVEYRASIRARDKAHSERLAAIRETGDKLLSIAEAEASKARNAQEELLSLSMARLRATVKGVNVNGETQK